MERRDLQLPRDGAAGQEEGAGEGRKEGRRQARGRRRQDAGDGKLGRGLLSHWPHPRRCQVGRLPLSPLPAIQNRR